METTSKRFLLLFTVAVLLCAVAMVANAQETVTAQYLYVYGGEVSGSQGRIAGYRIAPDGTLTQTQGAFPTSEFVISAAPSAHGARLFALGLRKIWSFSVNPANGTLKFLSSTVFPGNIAARGMGINPLSTLMFVGKTVSQSNGVSVSRITSYKISPAGTIRPVASSVVPFVLKAMAVDNTGRFLYASVLNGPDRSDFVDAFAINSTTGDLTFVGETASGPLSFGESMLIDSTNRFLYEGSAGSTVSVFSRNPITGRLTFLSQVNCGCDGTALVSSGPIALNSTGKILFQSPDNPGVAFYSVDRTTGLITPLPNDFIKVQDLVTLAADKAHNLLFVRNFATKSIDAYHVSDTGAVTPTRQEHIRPDPRVNLGFSMTVLAVKR